MDTGCIEDMEEEKESCLEGWVKAGRAHEEEGRREKGGGEGTKWTYEWRSKNAGGG